MLNPSDIAGKKFDKYMGKGYRQEEVDGYLRQLSGDVEALLEEKQALERKMEILADKLIEYKNDEDSLRSALIGAQKLGDTVIREAKEKAGHIIDEANAKAYKISYDAKTAMEREQTAFVRMQHEVASFKNRLQLIYKQHLELISSLPVEESTAAAPKPTPAAPPVDVRAREPEYERELQAAQTDSVRERIYYDAPVHPSDDLADYDDEELLARQEDDTQRLTIGDDTDELPELSYDQEPGVNDQKVGRYESRFGPLKFGSDYNIKRDDKNGKNRR